jgi:hypothetical protein
LRSRGAERRKRTALPSAVRVAREGRPSRKSLVSASVRSRSTSGGGAATGVVAGTRALASSAITGATDWGDERTGGCVAHAESTKSEQKQSEARITRELSSTPA